MKKVLLIASVIATMGANAENAITDWELGWTDVTGQDQWSQYHGDDQWAWSQVPAEFGYDENWNGDFISVTGSSNCATAIANNISVNQDGVGNTTIIGSVQNSIGDQTATCIFTENYYGESYGVPE